ncbi:MAG: c-type cytochrome [Chitinophagales bacterium]|nr:c-type cytochrome [Chitinophagales bacterium]
MRLKKLVFLITLLSLTIFYAPFNLAVAQDAMAATDGAAATTDGAGGGNYDKGLELFNANCASCHKWEGNLTGPALKGVIGRWEGAGEFKGVDGRGWMKRWIKNWQDPVNSGYDYAVKIQNYAPTAMTQFPQLSDGNLNDLLAYLETGPKEIVTDGPTPPDPPQNPYGDYFIYILVAVLLVVAIILWRVSGTLERLVAEKDGVPLPEPIPFYKNRKIWGIVILILLIYAGNATVQGAINLGRQQGYAPVQPVKFPHDIHAGIDKIDCKYCHSGAAKSKHANIPSVNTCMNCHKGITEAVKNGRYGRKEITKIFASIGFDPNTGQYIANYAKMPKKDAEAIFRQWLKDDKQGASEQDIQAVLNQIQKPLEWVRIHNLPDHVYFNHSQHVVVGGVACQTCHGPVETMEVMTQYSPLSMGWCISCHRQHEVNFSGNGYYKTFAKYQEEVKAGKLKKVTVEKMGGTECQKCHY